MINKQPFCVYTHSAFEWLQAHCACDQGVYRPYSSVSGNVAELRRVSASEKFGKNFSADDARGALSVLCDKLDKFDKLAGSGRLDGREGLPESDHMS